MKSIALALSNYESDHGVLPPAYTVDAQGRPLHSWRTLILPYMGQQVLYDTIDLTKPWDDPVNAAAPATAVLDYHCQQSSGPANTTTYRAVVGLNACFLPDRPRRLDEITDNPDQTLMVIEADEESAVPWMTPVDADLSLILRLSPKSKTAHLGAVNAVFANGNNRVLKLDLSPEIRQALVTIAGGEELDPDTP